MAEPSKPEAKPSEAASACEGASAKPPEATRGEDKLTGEGPGTPPRGDSQQVHSSEVLLCLLIVPPGKVSSSKSDFLSLFFSFFVCLGDTAVLHRGTPLYGQPAWWGDEDADHSGRPEENRSGTDRTKEKAETGIFFPTIIVSMSLVSIHLFPNAQM